MINRNFRLSTLLTMNNNERDSFFWKKPYRIGGNVKKGALITITNFVAKKAFSFSYPHESDNTMLFPMLVLVLFSLFVGAIAIPFNQEGIHLDILSKLLTPSINLLHQNSNNFEDWYKFLTNATLDRKSVV